MSRLISWLNRRQPEWLERLRLGAPLDIGSIGQLALTLRSSWRPDDVFVLLVSKIDESNTHDRAEFMTMAGFTGRLGQWNRFDSRWRTALRKAKLPVFHAQEHRTNEAMVRKVIRIPNDNLMFGFVVRLDKRTYEQTYRSGGWGGKAQPDTMYGLCFRYCLSMILEVGIHEYGKDLELNFILEEGHVNSGAPNEIVRRIKEQKVKDAAEYLGSVSLMPKEKCYGLQAADGLATGAMWNETSKIVSVADISGAAQLSDLNGKSLLKAPIFRVHIDEKEAAKARDDVFRWVEFRREFGRQRAAEIASRKRLSSSDRSS